MEDFSFDENENKQYPQYEDEYNKSTKPGDPVLYPITLPVAKARGMARAMMFVSIVTLISGIFMCVSSQIAVGILTIIASVKLKSAAGIVFDAVNGNNSYKEELLGDELAGYYRLYGWSLLISLISAGFIYFSSIGSLFNFV